jgi:hypothetical protein
MHVDTTAGLQGVVQTVENLGHVQSLCGNAVVADGFAEVLDVER